MRPFLLASAVLLPGLACSPHVENTSVGAPAPEIAGKDLDGVAFRLSDYRGKVVLLDFWGDWSPPCRATYAHLRSLVEQYDDAPFALVGVNGDRDPGELAAKDIRWRSFWDGPDGRPGPIAEAWDVRIWPAIFLIDAKGVIRSKFLGANEAALESAIDELLAEVP